MRRFNVTRKALLRYASYNPKYFPLRILSIIFEQASPYFNLWISSEIVTALYAGRQGRELYLLVAIALAGNLFVQVMRAVFNRMAETAHKVLRDNEAAAFYWKTLSLDYDKIENPQVRHLRNKILENSMINGYGVWNMKLHTEEMISNIVNIAFCAVLFAEMVSRIAAVSFRIQGAVLLVALLGFMALIIIIRARNGKKLSAYWDGTGDLMLRENRWGKGVSKISGMDSRIYRQQGIINRVEEKLNKEHLRVFASVRLRTFFLGIKESVLLTLLQLCSYAIVCFYCILGAFPVGSIIKYVGYLGNVTRGIGSFFYHLSELGNNERFLETYLEYFGIPNDMYQGSLAVEKRSDGQFEIEFRNVSFRYAGMNPQTEVGDGYALKNINLTLKVGERLAVVGQNGSGKTTFIKLLCRLYDPTEGEIFMNDFNIRKYDYRQYLDLFSVVFQDYNLLAVPLGNNISSGASWDTAKAEELLEKVGFGKRYQEMAKGLETPLYKNFDEDGVNLSGGEAQKIALARALYKDAPFIILDEPTAALDPIAEAEIYAKFDEIVGDKTAIYISHRLSSCRFCDKIAVFDGGRIVQTGTHEELLADVGGKYYELWNAQAQYYA